METAIGGGLVGFLLFYGAFVAVLLAVLWELDSWMFRDVPWWLMPIVVPVWLVVTIWRGLIHAD